jgi:hypothetical protein
MAVFTWTKTVETTAAVYKSNLNEDSIKSSNRYYSKGTLFEGTLALGQKLENMPARSLVRRHCRYN